MTSQDQFPLYEPHEVWQKIQSMKKKKSTVKGDIPWKIICEYSVELAFPLCNIYNTGNLNGEWPNIWKYEYVTPALKVFPPGTTDDLRKISGITEFSNFLIQTITVKRMLSLLSW
jgi:hypothetical protein